MFIVHYSEAVREGLETTGEGAEGPAKQACSAGCVYEELWGQAGEEGDGRSCFLFFSLPSLYFVCYGHGDTETNRTYGRAAREVFTSTLCSAGLEGEVG